MCLSAAHAAVLTTPATAFSTSCPPESTAAAMVPAVLDAMLTVAACDSYTPDTATFVDGTNSAASPTALTIVFAATLVLLPTTVSSAIGSVTTCSKAGLACSTILCRVAVPDTRVRCSSAVFLQAAWTGQCLRQPLGSM
jgi:hypothetical protein